MRIVGDDGVGVAGDRGGHQRGAEVGAVTTARQRVDRPHRFDHAAAQRIRLAVGGASAHTSTDPHGAPAAAAVSMTSLSSVRNVDGPRGLDSVAPQW